MVELRRFPCGEFLPGQEPRSLPTNQTPNNLPALYHPSRVEPQDPFYQVQDPGVRTPGGGRGGGSGGGTGGGPGPSGGGNGGPGTGDTGGPGGGPGGGQGGGGPTTGGGTKCIKGELRCTTNNRVRQVLRTPRGCPAADAARDTQIARFRFVNFNGGYDSRADDLCLAFDSVRASNNFFAGCINGDDNPQVCVVNPITGGRGGLAADAIPQTPTGQGGEPGGPTTSASRPSTVTLTSQQERVGNQAGSIDNSRLASQSLINSIPVKQAKVLDLSDPELERFASASSTSTSRLGLYDGTYNFFNAVPNQQTEMVYNYQYLNIFKQYVAREIIYFLNKELGDTSIWHEQAVKDLTKEKIIISLNDQLLTVINNLHNVNNTRIDPNVIVEVIRSHILAGTLSEFDPDYFTSVYNSQLDDSIITIPTEGQSGKALQLSMGLFERDSKSPDFRNYDNKIERDNFKRFRVLLEDIEANLNTELIDGTSGTLYLNNAGIPTEYSSTYSGHTTIGDGAGYYISSKLIDGQELPLVTNNILSTAFFLPPDKRANLLELLGTNIDIILKANSTSAHELSQDYNPSGDLAPMYFKINFDSIGDILNPNSVINIMSATFTRISDADAVNHSRNYSYNTIRVNIDHRDPFIHYARDTSTILLEQDDFNLRSFGRNSTILMGKIILRNLPAAVVLVPGMGSYHNPFNSKSKILNFENIIVRTLNVTPSFDVKNRSLIGPPLSSTNVYNTVGTPYFGVYERDFDPDIHGNLYTYNPNSNDYLRSYFSAGVYSNQQPDASLREPSIESKLINGIVKKLTEISGVEELTWWDIYRRLNSKDIGKLSYTNIQEINTLLANGFVNDIKVFNVLSTIPLYPTGIPDGAEILNDTIILTEENRTYVP